MTVNSFSQETKNTLCGIITKPVCCRRALLCGILMFRQPQENDEIIHLTERLEDEFISDDFYTPDIDGLFRCEGCRRCFLRGVFLACGMITDPSKLYQLELTMRGNDSAEDICGLLEECGFTPKRMIRRGLEIIYLKDNEAVSDFLSLIGAQKAYFELINVKIRKEFRNTANRITNCDAANITRTVSAAHSQLEAIKELRQSGHIGSLPSELYETARLRAENEDATLNELAQLHNPPITKSGVNHRLKKIMEFCGSDKNKSEKQ